MKLIQIIWILVILALVLGCQKKEQAEQGVAGQEELTTTTEPEAVSISDVSAFSYVCLPYTGSYEHHDTVIGAFMQATGNQGIKLSGPMLGVYYNSPMDTPEDSLIWEIGFEVPDTTKVSEPLVIKTWIFTKVAKAMHTGTYETVDQTYPKIFEFIGKQNMMPAGPTMERFISDPQKVAPDSLKTEIWVPVSSG